MIDYHLPPELIAQQPLEPRDRARMLVVDRHHETLTHAHVHDLPAFLKPGDRLVLNDTRVVPARLRGRRERTGGRWEGLFLQEHPEGTWELLARSGGRPQPGEWIAIEPGPLRLQLRGRGDDPQTWLARPEPAGTASELLARHGSLPLPPYIRKGVATPGDDVTYQTVFAREPGAVAAPTAGLHFTPELLDRLADMGVPRSFVTLHVGPGTFRPMNDPDPAKHVMHREWAEVPVDTVNAIHATRAAGGRILAVGTTSVRSLETAAASGVLAPWRGETNLFIHPPYPFRCVDLMLTNFHLPQTTLLLLVEALAGTELLAEAYRVAVAERYRFYSYGDAMLIC